MTTIVVRDGVMAADSRITLEDESMGTVFRTCDKIFAIGEGKRRVLIGLQGENEPGLVFMDWYRQWQNNLWEDPTGATLERPASLAECEDFTAIVLRKGGRMYEYGKYCRGDRVKGRFYAIGSGAKAAYGALHMGANARAAVRIACKIDPYSSLPVTSLTI